MFTLVVEFKNGLRNFIYNLNRVACENLMEKYNKDSSVSYVAVLDENF